MIYVLDASALLRLLLNQPGAARVEQILEGGYMRTDRVLISAVNWGEVVGKIDRERGRPTALGLRKTMEHYGLEIVASSSRSAEEAALLKRDSGIGYADAFCLQLAVERSAATLVTADFDFAPLKHQHAIEFLPNEPVE